MGHDRSAVVAWSSSGQILSVILAAVESCSLLTSLRCVGWVWFIRGVKQSSCLSKVATKKCEDHQDNVYGTNCGCTVKDDWTLLGGTVIT